VILLSQSVSQSVCLSVGSASEQLKQQWYPCSNNVAAKYLLCKLNTDCTHETRHTTMSKWINDNSDLEVYGLRNASAPSKHSRDASCLHKRRFDDRDTTPRSFHLAF
jgi:hypothetical protein